MLSLLLMLLLLLLLFYRCWSLIGVWNGASCQT